MRRIWLLIPLVLVGVVWLYGCDETLPTQPTVAGQAETPLLSPKFPVKTDGTCQVGQTVVWDGEAWACADLGDWRFHQSECSVAPGETKGCWAYCNPGTRILGGGHSFQTTVAPGETVLQQSQPIWSGGTKGWLVRVSNHTASKTVTFKSFGICAQIPSNVD